MGGKAILRRDRKSRRETARGRQRRGSSVPENVRSIPPIAAPPVFVPAQTRRLKTAPLDESNRVK